MNLNVMQIYVNGSKIQAKHESRVNGKNNSGCLLTGRKNTEVAVLSDTLTRGLQHYRIGEKLRALRLKKKMGLVELGQHSGLSPALLSKIERGRLVPTLPTLLRVALVFSVGLEHFFNDPGARPTLAVVRRGERQRFPERQGEKHPAYYFESLDYPAVDRLMNAYYVEFEPGDPGDDDRQRRHSHPGAELLYVVSGRLAITVGEEAHELAAGDSIYFDPSVPHRYRRLGARACHAVVVTTQR
jgi:quercetin dioxygenase-like cupin family protein/DNA-binding XRE family transcriptional regulator